MFTNIPLSFIAKGGKLMNHKFITSLTPKSKTYKKGLGQGLFILVEKVYQGKTSGNLGGRKYFKGRVKGQEIWVGVFGNKSGQLTLKNAREKFSEIMFKTKQN